MGSVVGYTQRYLKKEFLSVINEIIQRESSLPNCKVINFYSKIDTNLYPELLQNVLDSKKPTFQYPTRTMKILIIILYKAVI